MSSVFSKNLVSYITMKTNRVRLDPSEPQLQQLQVLGDRVSALWNAANYSCRQLFIAGDKMPSYNSLDGVFRSHNAFRALPSDIAQETLKKLAEAWKSFFALRKLYNSGGLNDKPGLPKYRKDRKTGMRLTDFIPIKCDRSYRVNAWTIEVTMPKDISKSRLVMSYRGIKRYIGKGKRSELLYDSGRNRWYMSYGVETVEPKQRNGVKAGIDLGVRILASLSIEGLPTALHFAGRDVLKEWQYWNRKIAIHQQEIAHRNKKSSKQLSRLYRMRKARMRHAWDAGAKAIANHCRRHNVGEVLMGWPKGSLDEVKASRKWKGILHGFWSFDQMSERIEQALNRVGIKTERVGERGTSSHCPTCSSAHVVRVPRWVLRCKDCHTAIHSDQAGSRNVIRQKYPVLWDEGEAPSVPDTRRWSRHQWVDAYNRSAHTEHLVAA